MYAPLHLLQDVGVTWREDAWRPQVFDIWDVDGPGRAEDGVRHAECWKRFSWDQSLSLSFGPLPASSLSCPGLEVWGVILWVPKDSSLGDHTKGPWFWSYRVGVPASRCSASRCFAFFGVGPSRNLNQTVEVSSFQGTW